MPFSWLPARLRWLAQAAFAVSATMGTAAYAQCPEQHEPVGDQSFHQNGAAYRVQLCGNPRGDASGFGGSLRVTAYQGERRTTEASFPIDVEGQVKAIRFDRVNYVRSAKAPTFPVLIGPGCRWTAGGQLQDPGCTLADDLDPTAAAR